MNHPLALTLPSQSLEYTSVTKSPALLGDGDPEGVGGVAYSNHGAKVHLHKVSGKYSRADYYGGIIFAGGSARADITSCNFRSCQAGKGGGAVHAEGADTKVSMNRTHLVNLAAGLRGAGLHAMDKSTVTMSDCEFSLLRLMCGRKFGDKATADKFREGAGAMFRPVVKANREIDPNTIANPFHYTNAADSASCSGAGIYASDGSSVIGGDHPDSNVFENLSADRGAGIAVCGTTVHVSGMTMRGLSSIQGAGFYMASSTWSKSTHAVMGGGDEDQNATSRATNATEPSVLPPPSITPTAALVSHIAFADTNASAGGGVFFSVGSPSNVLKVRHIHVHNAAANLGAVFYLQRGGNASVQMFHMQELHAEVDAAVGWISGGSVLHLDSGHITNTSAGDRAGAFFVDGESVAHAAHTVASGTRASTTGGFFFATGRSTVTLDDSTVLKSSAGTAGGFAFLTGGSMLNLYGISTVQGAKAGTHGGAIYAELASQVVGGGASILQNSSALKSGGGVYADGSRILLRGFTARETVSKKGGGIYVNGGHCTMENVRVQQSRAMTGGGGVFIDEAGTLILTERSSVSGCSASFGGGILVTAASKLVADGASVVANNSALRGGGILVEKRSVATLANNTRIVGCSAKDGGGVMIREESNLFTRSGAMIEGCSASNQGGGLAIFGDAVADMENTTVRLCIAMYGGGILSDGCLVNFRRSLVAQNVALEGGFGGGAFLTKGARGSATKETEFRANVATKGGGLYIEYLSYMYIYESTLRANEAIYDGGGAFINGALMFLKDALLKANMAEDEGGGVNVQNGGNLTTEGARFDQNAVGGREDTGAGVGSHIVFGRSSLGSLRTSAFVGGRALASGGVYATEAIIEVDRCDFERNYAQEGSALMLERTTKAQIWSSQWRDNTATTNDGAAVLVRGEVRAEFVSCEIGPRNTAPKGRGGGMHIDKQGR